MGHGREPAMVVPTIANSKNKLGAGIDVKSTGGYVVVAPSEIGPSKSGPGGSYRWEVSPFDVAVPRLPIWLMTMLAPCAPPPRRRPYEGSSGGSGEIDRLAKWVARGAEGERNNRLYWAACRVGEMAKEYKVSPRAAGQTLVSAAVQAGLESGNAVQTVNSGFKKSGLEFKP